MTLDEAMQLVMGMKCSQKQLAYELGCTQSAIPQWDAKKIPWARELQVKDIVARRKESARKKAKKEAVK